MNAQRTLLDGLWTLLKSLLIRPVVRCDKTGAVHKQAPAERRQLRSPATERRTASARIAQGHMLLRRLPGWLMGKLFTHGEAIAFLNLIPVN